MNKLFSLTLILFLSSALAMAERCMIVESKDGSTVAFVLEQEPKVIFSDEQMLIKDSEREVSLFIADVRRIRHGEFDTNSVEEISEAQSDSFNFKGNCFIVTAGDKSVVVSLYDLSGIRISLEKIESHNTKVVSLESFAAGIYLANINGATYKIVKK